MKFPNPSILFQCEMDYSYNHLQMTSRTTVAFPGLMYITDGIKAGAKLSKY